MRGTFGQVQRGQRGIFASLPSQSSQPPRAAARRCSAIQHDEVGQLVARGDVSRSSVACGGDGILVSLHTLLGSSRGNCGVLSLSLVYYFRCHFFSSHTSVHYQVPCCFTHLAVCQSPGACGRALKLCTSTFVSTDASPVSCSIYCE